MSIKQNMYQCLKVNKTWGKCHVNFMRGMPEGRVTTRIVWVPRKLYDDWRFSTPWERRRESTEEWLGVTPLCALALCQTTKGWVVEKALNCTRLAKVKGWYDARKKGVPCNGPVVEKRIEVKMIKCLKVMQRSVK